MSIDETKVDTGVEVYDNKIRKKQRHAPNELPNLYINIVNKKTYVIKLP